MELVARSLSVMAADISRWQEAFFDGAECESIRGKIGPCGQEDQTTVILVGLDHHGQRAAAREDRNDGDGPPFCAQEVDAMSAAISFLREKGLTVFRGSAECGRSTVRACIVIWAATADRSERKRPGSVGAMPDAET